MDKINTHDVDMKMRILGVVFMTFILGFMSGCGTISKIAGKQITPYDQGYKDVESYVLVRPFVPEQHRAVIKALYQVVNATPDLADLTDTFLEVQVARLYEGKATAEDRAAILVLFRDARNSLLDQVNTRVGVPQDEIFAEYMKGANDAVYYYGLIKREEAASSEKAAVMELIDLLAVE